MFEFSVAWIGFILCSLCSHIWISILTMWTHDWGGGEEMNSLEGEGVGQQTTVKNKDEGQKGPEIVSGIAK